MTIADMTTNDQVKFWKCVLSFDPEILFPFLSSKNVKNSKEQIYIYFFLFLFLLVHDCNFVSHVTGGNEADSVPARTAQEDIWA